VRKLETALLKLVNQFFMGILLLGLMESSLGKACGRHKVDESDSYDCLAPKAFAHWVNRKCVYKDPGGYLNLTSEARAKVEYNEDDLAEINVPGFGCYWANPVWGLTKVHCMSGGADPFSEGKARHLSESGKFGFVSKSLERVISPIYDFATPFRYGYSKVCTGCKTQPAGGDHSLFAGGVWKIINKKGEVVKQCASARMASECNL
jgi:hypothetical protein